MELLFSTQIEMLDEMLKRSIEWALLGPIFYSLGFFPSFVWLFPFFNKKISRLGHYIRILHIWTKLFSASLSLIFRSTKIQGDSETGVCILQLNYVTTTQMEL